MAWWQRPAGLPDLASSFPLPELSACDASSSLLSSRPSPACSTEQAGRAEGPAVCWRSSTTVGASFSTIACFSLSDILFSFLEGPTTVSSFEGSPTTANYGFEFQVSSQSPSKDKRPAPGPGSFTLGLITGLVSVTMTCVGYLLAGLPPHPQGTRGSRRRSARAHVMFVPVRAVLHNPTGAQATRGLGRLSVT